MGQKSAQEGALTGLTLALTGGNLMTARLNRAQNLQ